MNQSRGCNRSVAAVLFLLAFAAVSSAASAQSADDIVRKVVHNELDADFNDHTSWMYRDTYKSPDKNIVKIVIETPQGNLSEIVEDNGRPPSAEEHQNDLDHMQQIIVDPALRARMKRAEQHDGDQAREMMNLLPNAFVWHVIDHANGEITFSFHPAPSFSPDSMSARVLAAMSGTMVVDEQAIRLKKSSPDASTTTSPLAGVCSAASTPVERSISGVRMLAMAAGRSHRRTCTFPATRCFSKALVTRKTKSPAITIAPLKASI